MDLSPQGAAFVRAHEGFEPHWYADPTGTGTIGIGFTWASGVFRTWWEKNRPGVAFGKGAAMTEAEAGEVLPLLVREEYGAAVNRFFGKDVPQHVFDAMVSAVFNLGPKALKWRWAAAAKRGDYAEAARLLTTTGTTSKGKKLPGLIRRRAEEALLLEKGVYTSGKKAPKPKVRQPAQKVTRPATAYTSEAIIRVVQEKLTALNYPLGSIDPKTGGFDGVLGDLTRSAIRDFRKDNGLPDSDTIDAALLTALDSAKPRVLPRAATAAEDIRKIVPEAQDSWLNRWAGGAVAGFAAVYGLAKGAVENFQAARETLTPYLAYFPGIQEWMVFCIIAGAGGFIYWRSTRADQSIKAALRVGARL